MKLKKPISTLEVIPLEIELVRFESSRRMDYKCTYCTIPLARGISRSDALENVLKMLPIYRNKE